MRETFTFVGTSDAPCHLCACLDVVEQLSTECGAFLEDGEHAVWRELAASMLKGKEGGTWE